MNYRKYLQNSGQSNVSVMVGLTSSKETAGTVKQEEFNALVSPALPDKSLTLASHGSPKLIWILFFLKV